MYDWTTTSLLKFHPEKCCTMRVGSSIVKKREYTMGPDKAVLRKVSEEKDIGVTVDDKLSFSNHMATKIKKANSIMGVIRRTYAYLDDDTTFLLLYKALVRPHLEYANQVWSPHLKKDIVAIENVQRRATKMLPGMRDLTYEQQLRNLKLPTLHYRRLRGDMIEMYKILNGKYDPSVADFIPLKRSETRGHNLKIFKQHTRLNTRKFAFVHRSANIWNSLPADVVDSNSVDIFERRLDHVWSREPMKYNSDEDKLTCTWRMQSGQDLDLTAEASA